MKYSHSLSILVLSFAGLLFSGYLSAVKFFTASCALGIACPTFLGYPACYFGFAMYVLLVLCAALLYSGGGLTRVGRTGIMVVSFVGVLFSGYYTVGELAVLFNQGVVAYIVALPTCAFGFLVFTAIFLLSLTAREKIVAGQGGQS